MRNPAEAAARQRISLLEYLEQRGWTRVGNRGSEEVRGLCPLHEETRASFYVNQRKQVFYCHGCGRGGDLIRLVQLCEGIGYAQARRKVEQPRDGGPVMAAAIRFYQQQLEDHRPAMHYLLHRGVHEAELIRQMGIGYAPGGCLRAHLAAHGYHWSAMRASGLIDAYGRDYFYGCVVFPLAESGSMYGRSVTDHGARHRFLARPKGGLYGWSRSGGWEEVIVVEGLFDVAVLWQAGFPNTVAVMGSSLNHAQKDQLRAGGQRRVYVCLDSDPHGAGQRAAAQMCIQLRALGVRSFPVELPAGHDPNSLFQAGVTAEQFGWYLEQARP